MYGEVSCGIRYSNVKHCISKVMQSTVRYSLVKYCNAKRSIGVVLLVLFSSECVEIKWRMINS